MLRVIEWEFLSSTGSSVASELCSHSFIQTLTLLCTRYVCLRYEMNRKSILSFSVKLSQVRSRFRWWPTLAKTNFGQNQLWPKTKFGQTKSDQDNFGQTVPRIVAFQPTTMRPGPPSPDCPLPRSLWTAVTLTPTRTNPTPTGPDPDRPDP